ncbi:Indigoidine synthase A like protein-domain-containing protein [Sphaerosporella brunnea]|uniref:Indigoidine synthase A like protein-domain-containing protein n=1 Tax=Sphaerosporella brunnea TaxID=1250544 RepID=A0A5J5EH78_9PEZI|nr:Indigoidine synthase A like protein-domain-containing protein [Sphaerosporella brunnea]
MRSLLNPLRYRPALRRRTYATLGGNRLNQFLKISDEVRSAVAAGKPVVALESAIYTHGFPHPQNLDLARAIEKTVRDNGAVPATICILEGNAVVGLSDKELEQLAESFGKQGTIKVSRRDLAYVTGLPFVDSLNKFVGGTTIAGTSVLAHMAGIKVFATGGLGGVHRGVEKTMDVSADLTELGRTPVALICAGSKAFLDLRRTLEYLETEGVYVGTFGDRKSGQPVQYPAFYSRGCGIISPSVVQDAKEAAGIIYASHSLGLTSGQLFANPIPKEYEIPNEEIQDIIKVSVEAAETASTGNDVTPFILADILKRTAGRSIEANRGLIMNNAMMGAKVAMELAKLEEEGAQTQTTAMPHMPTPSASSQAKKTHKKTTSDIHKVDTPEVLVIGGVAVDVNCDYVLRTASTDSTPVLHTSNPSIITESLGGVANNVAYALHLSGIKTLLVSCTGADISGSWVRDQMQKRGMDTSGLASSTAYNTARYVAVNDGKGGLFVASADMNVIEQMDPENLAQATSSTGAQWVVIDGNLAAGTIVEVLRRCSKKGIKVVFEPTSAAKSTAIFSSPKKLGTFPTASLYAAAPNAQELDAMYHAASDAELFSTELPWWGIIDSLLLDSEFRTSIDALSRSSGVDLVSTGLVQKAVNLLPYIPNLFVKLGEKGCLVVSLLPPDHKALNEKRRTAGAVVVKARLGQDTGGLLVRHFEPESVQRVVSVNGAGDTFLGVVVAGMVRGEASLGSIVERAQRAAVLTLQSTQAVSEKIRDLVWE